MDTAEVTRPRSTAKPKLNAGFKTSRHKHQDERPQAAKLIFILGVICLLLSSFLAVYGYRISKDPLAFLTLIYGVLEFAACAGFSSIINLLNEIRKNTESI